MLNSALDKEIEKGLLQDLYYFWSEEDYFLDDVLRKAVERVVSSSQADFNYDLFYPSSDPGQIIDAASTLPFMASRRLVVLKGFNQYSKAAVDSLLPYFRKPSENTCMIVLSQKAPVKKLSDIPWKLYKLGIEERDIPAWIKRLASDKGIQMTGEAVDCLIDYVGFDAGLLASEVDKLSMSGKKRIDEKDIASSISAVREYTTFNLIDALVAEQRTRAFMILESILSEKMLATSVLGTLNWHYREFYNLWLNKGKKPQKMRMSTFNMLSKHVKSYNEDAFQRIFQTLHEADVAIKSSGRPELVLEILLIRLLQKRRAN
ncbi:MAG: DNA polymerase III subunit delta [Thermodesulfovibrionia bacterium]|nr:DNA polymerase III subunit delta [Thermodesulfovibrionia bacterium]